ncbi:PEP-utilizing enzyme [Tessaracoccus sp. Y36]
MGRQGQQRGQTSRHDSTTGRLRACGPDIPAVMGTGTGTSAISDGDAITVDGTRGRVTRGARGARG